MKILEFRGMGGLLLLIVLGLLAAGALILIPALVLMVLWNLVIASELSGPVITLFSGELLWGVVGLLLVLVFRPSIEIQMEDGSAQPPVDMPPDPQMPNSSDKLLDETAYSIIGDDGVVRKTVRKIRNFFCRRTTFQIRHNHEMTPQIQVASAAGGR